MTLQYLRKVQLSVTATTKDQDRAPIATYSLDDMHIQFHIFSATTSTLKHADIVIWNLSKDKANALMKEFTTVQLSAGYEGSFGLIFSGETAYVRIGKDNAVNSYVRITAQDADKSKNWSFSNFTLAAGWTDGDLYKQLMADFGKFGLQAGYKPAFTVNPNPRAFVAHDKTDSLMDGLAVRQNCNWFIEDGKVNLVPKGSYLPGPVEVLSSDTGMIGVPEQTFNGIECTCLLRPGIKTGGRVQIQNSDIAQFNQKNVFQREAGLVVPSLQGNSTGVGIYKTLCVEHFGDTRGNEWYTKFIGVSIDGTGVGQNSPAFFSVPSDT